MAKVEIEWLDLVEKLNLEGSTLEFARQSRLMAFENTKKQIMFHLHFYIGASFDEDCIFEIKRALAKYFNRVVNVTSEIKPALND